MTAVGSAGFHRALVRLAAGLLALLLFGLPLHTAPLGAVAVIGGTGLVLAAVGIAALWRWPVTAAACVFLTAYATALFVAARAVSVVESVGFGLALLLLFQSVELGRCLRAAEVGAGVYRSQIGGWIALGAGMLVATMLVVAVAGAGAASIPFALAPIVAAVGAVGVVLALAAVVRGGNRPG
jgi:hypothetical protein